MKDLTTMNEKLTGIIVPTATPFDELGDLSMAKFVENMVKWHATGVRGYMCLGSNGEFRSLSDDESLRLVREAAQLKQDKTLIVGVGRESLRLTIAFIDQVAVVSPGVDYVSVLTPHYFPRLMDDNALFDYYVAVADHSPVPVLIYVAPGFANALTVSSTLLQRLASHPNIHGVKDNTPSMMAEYMLAVRDRPGFAVLAGSLNNLMTCLLFGGPGGVVSAANYFPAQCAQVTDLYFSGDHLRSLQYYARLQQVVKLTGGKHGVSSLKACMDACGFFGGNPRPPVKPLAPEQQAAIRNELLSSHILD